jgi:hypothetical protein
MTGYQSKKLMAQSREDDLVKRLLEPVIDPFFGPVIEPIKKEAADRIEQLESLLKKLDDKFASYKPYFGAEHSCDVNISFALIEEIRAALREKKDG